MADITSVSWLAIISLAVSVIAMVIALLAYHRDPQRAAMRENRREIVDYLSNARSTLNEWTGAESQPPDIMHYLLLSGTGLALAAASPDVKLQGSLRLHSRIIADIGRGLYFGSTEQASPEMAEELRKLGQVDEAITSRLRKLEMSRF